MRALGKIALFFLLFSIVLSSIATLPEFNGIGQTNWNNEQVDLLEEKKQRFTNIENNETETSRGLLSKVSAILGGSEVFNLAFTVVSTFSWAFSLITGLIGNAAKVIDFVLLMPENGPTFGTVVQLALGFVMVFGFIRVITGREF